MVPSFSIKFSLTVHHQMIWCPPFILPDSSQKHIRSNQFQKFFPVIVLRLYIKSHRNNPANGSKCETFWSICSAAASKFSRFVDRSIAAILTGLQWLVHQDQDDNSGVKRYILSIIVLDHYKVNSDNVRKTQSNNFFIIGQNELQIS